LNFLRDPVSSASHFLAAALAVVVTAFLVRLAGRDRTRRASVLVFGTCMTFLYASSGLYHALHLPADELRIYQRLDMSAIYLMIAGSCTPMMAILLRGRFRAVLLTGQWGLAAVGIAALWLRPKPDHAVLVGTYLGLGWLGTVGIWHYWRATGWRGVSWALAGAAFYTAGAAVELARWPILIPGVVQSHELLHLFDIAGTVCHIVFIARYVLPYQPAEAAATREATQFNAAQAGP